jgi:hypothetical protein
MTAHATAAAVLVVAALTSGHDGEPCKRVTEEYHAARSEVFAAIETYERCIDASQGRSECADEFADLDLAQAQHERALTEYRRACQ